MEKSVDQIVDDYMKLFREKKRLHAIREFHPDKARGDKRLESIYTVLFKEKNSWGGKNEDDFRDELLRSIRTQLDRNLANAERKAANNVRLKAARDRGAEQAAAERAERAAAAQARIEEARARAAEEEARAGAAAAARAAVEEEERAAASSFFKSMAQKLRLDVLTLVRTIKSKESSGPSDILASIARDLETEKATFINAIKEAAKAHTYSYGSAMLAYPALAKAVMGVIKTANIVGKGEEAGAGAGAGASATRRASRSPRRRASRSPRRRESARASAKRTIFNPLAMKFFEAMSKKLDINDETLMTLINLEEKSGSKEILDSIVSALRTDKAKLIDAIKEAAKTNLYLVPTLMMTHPKFATAVGEVVASRGGRRRSTRRTVIRRRRQTRRSNKK